MRLSRKALTWKELVLAALRIHSSSAQQLHPLMRPGLTLQTEEGAELGQTTGSSNIPERDMWLLLTLKALVKQRTPLCPFL